MSRTFAEMDMDARFLRLEASIAQLQRSQDVLRTACDQMQVTLAAILHLLNLQQQEDVAMQLERASRRHPEGSRP